jgi:DNA modification methylase
MRNPGLNSPVVEEIPTRHRLEQGDARDLSFLEDGSIHLVVTSPPYWTLKRYNETEGQPEAIAGCPSATKRTPQKILFDNEVSIH